MSQDDDSQDIKVILVGEPGTGKTSLINVAIGQQFSQETSSTLISTFVQKRMIKGKQEYILNIWDTAGQEKFRAMTKIFIKNAKIVIFVYSINNRDSFRGLKEYWYNTIKESLGDEPILGMVGNKSDLFLEEEVKEDDAKQFAIENEIMFKLVSAKEDPNGFVEYLENLLDVYLNKNGVIFDKRDTINIKSEDQNKNNQKKNCCK